MRRLISALYFVVIIGVGTVHGATIHVPGDQPTIQDGIAETTHGDTVLVGPGEYTGSFNFSGRRIVVISLLGPEVTFIGSTTNANYAITFGAQSGSGAELSGFTIRGSTAGAAVQITAGRPLIFQNRFLNNPVNLQVIKCVNASPTISRNLFVGNGGISCIGVESGKAFVISNTFDLNRRGFYAVLSGKVIAKNNIVSRSVNYGVYGSCELSYNDVWGNSPDYDNGAEPGDGCIQVDPMYSAPATLDYELLSGSPCVDAGDPSPQYNDIDGSRNDMGFGLFCSVPYGAGDCDGDGVTNATDNCPWITNTDQFDSDADGRGDVCDPCPQDSDPTIADSDDDGIGDVCDPCTDLDGDMFGDSGYTANQCATDNCPAIPNPDQSDEDADFLGDSCDNCPSASNIDQVDSDGDGAGDACDNCLGLSNPSQLDFDHDDVGSDCDNCPFHQNTSQIDSDGDGLGDACDPCPLDSANADADQDERGDVCDNCPTISNNNQSDLDNDGRGDVCDNCPETVNLGQEDADLDGVGDHCDNCDTSYNPSQADPDGDGLGGDCDNCGEVANLDQIDSDHDGFGDACDCQCYCHSDPVCDLQHDIVDVAKTIGVAFRNAPAIPDIHPDCPVQTTDMNCSGSTDVLDVVKIVNVAFRFANPATEFCNPCP